MKQVCLIAGIVFLAMGAFSMTKNGIEATTIGASCISGGILLLIAYGILDRLDTIILALPNNKESNRNKGKMQDFISANGAKIVINSLKDIIEGNASEVLSVMGTSANQNYDGTFVFEGSISISINGKQRLYEIIAHLNNQSDDYFNLNSWEVSKLFIDLPSDAIKIGANTTFIRQKSDANKN